jgi:threonine/homoserine/homoserine lactone efflux protein
MAYLTLVSTRWGRRAGFVTVAGVTLGLSVYMLLAVAGLAEAIMAAPLLYNGLRWAGVGYLVWLAWESWRAKGDAMVEVAAPSGQGLFLRGLTTNLLNPKILILYTALLPGFTNPALGRLGWQVFYLGLIHIGISLTIHSGLVLMGDRAHHIARPDPKGQGWRQGVMAACLLALAAWLAWETGRSA